LTAASAEAGKIGADGDDGQGGRQGFQRGWLSDRVLGIGFGRGPAGCAFVALVLR
jgi:hypothetical protein